MKITDKICANCTKDGYCLRIGEMNKCMQNKTNDIICLYYKVSVLGFNKEDDIKLCEKCKKAYSTKIFCPDCAKSIIKNR